MTAAATSRTAAGQEAAALPLRDELRGRSAYGAPQLDVSVRLNTNENPHPPPPELVAEVGARAAAVASTLNRYPDREAVALRADLAAYLSRRSGHAVATEGVWAANGSNEVLQQLLQAFGGPGRRALGFAPSYSMHQLLARGTGTDWVSVRRAPDAAVTPATATAAVAEHRPDVVLLCSPDNPTGGTLDPEVVTALYDAAQRQQPTLVVVDEAYVEFSHRPSLLPLLEGRPALVVTRTMSKAFAMAGARLGYLAAHPAVVDALRLVRLPYHLSSLTQEVARAALAYADDLLGTVEEVKRERDRLVAGLPALGFTVVPSDANFVLFGPYADQRRAWQTLLDEGVLVRDVGLAGWLRVTAGLPPEVDAFLEAVAATRGLLDESAVQGAEAMEGSP
ncbi:MAG: histidinol-phosphate transaminase [Actinomycetes bacterium]